MKIYKINLFSFLFKGKSLMYILFLHWPFIFGWFMKDIFYFLIFIPVIMSGAIEYFSLAWRCYIYDRGKVVTLDAENKRIMCIYNKDVILDFTFSDIDKIIRVGYYIPCYNFILKNGNRVWLSGLIMWKLNKTLNSYLVNDKAFFNNIDKPKLIITSNPYL